jgi:hypothetical protein
MDSIRKALLARAKRLDRGEAVPNVPEGDYLSGEDNDNDDDESSFAGFGDDEDGAGSGLASVLDKESSFEGFPSSSEESFQGFSDGDDDDALGEGVDSVEKYEDLALKAIISNLRDNPYRD